MYHRYLKNEKGQYQKQRIAPAKPIEQPSQQNAKSFFPLALLQKLGDDSGDLLILLILLLLLAEGNEDSDSVVMTLAIFLFLQ